MRFHKLTPFVLALVAISATPALAGAIEVGEARAEMMEGKTDRGDMFMSITNNGGAADRLYAVRTKVAAKAVLETESEEKVVAGESSETASLLVKPGETVKLTDDGAHIELFGLKKPFEEGETFTVTLFFEQAGPVKVTVTAGEK